MKQYLVLQKSRPFDVILLGRVTVDLNPVDYFKPLSQVSAFRKYLGGSPANIAVGLARLGKKVGFIGKVSDDSLGDFVTESFRTEGIDTTHLSRCRNGESMGLTFTEILSPQDSSILMMRHQVADLALSPQDISIDYIKKAKLLLISGTALSASPSREAALKALSIARQENTPVIFDIDYRPYNWKSADETSVYYHLVASQSTMVLGSREEYNLAAGFLTVGEDDRSTADYWLHKANRVVVIKHGKKGSTAYTADGGAYSVKPFPIKALKGFGGGDGYASAFLYGILEGLPMYDCLELGSASASLLVSSHACAQDMPDLHKLEAYIHACKEEYGEMIVRA